jgi:Fic family protein
MSMEHDLKLAQADSRIEQAERNIRQVESLLPQLSSQGYSTEEIEGHIELMSEALCHLKEQRRLIHSACH